MEFIAAELAYLNSDIVALQEVDADVNVTELLPGYEFFFRKRTG
jgi:protein angel